MATVDYDRWLQAPYYADSSDCGFDCSRCGAECDTRDTDRHEITDSVVSVRTRKITIETLDVCGDCVRSCSACGENIDNEVIETFGPQVMFREWAADGKFAFAHAVCAAELILQNYAEDGEECIIADLSKEQVAAWASRMETRAVAEGVIQRGFAACRASMLEAGRTRAAAEDLEAGRLAVKGVLL